MSFYKTKEGKVWSNLIHDSNSYIGQVKSYAQFIETNRDDPNKLTKERFETYLKNTKDYCMKVFDIIDKGYLYYKNRFINPDGVMLIQLERERQQEVEGWTAEHDDKYLSNELPQAALSYLLYDPEASDGYNYAEWPWDEEWFKPTTRIRNLEKAGALIAAEIDRLQRL